MLCHSYAPDYLSINDILCTEERISCKIEIDLVGLGFVDPSSEYDDLKAGSNLEFPLWLAHPLSTIDQPIVSVDVPKIYKEGYREILEADACAVVLSRWSPFYYELGMHLRTFTDKERITDCLLQIFKSRFRLVMDWAQNPISDPTLATQLPRLERELFLAGRKSKVQLIEWLKRGTGGIGTSEIAANLKKRKRSDYELD